MNKMRVNQYSIFEMLCKVDSKEVWRQAMHPNGDMELWEPDYDPEKEELCKHKSGEFFIISK